MSKIETADRATQMEEAFGLHEAPATNLPATQQIVMDDSPKGAIKVQVKRDLKYVMTEIRKVAAANGSEFFYTWKVKNKDGTTSDVEGPSVKCANAVARIYGNCMVRVRAEDLATHWVLNAQFVDLETGFVYERPFMQRKNQNVSGKMDKDRALDIVFQIGVSKAARNVVCNALSEFTDYAFDIAKAKIVETIGKNLGAYVTKVEMRLKELDVDITRVEAIRGHAKAKWTAADVAKIISEIQAVSDGMAHPDDLWPPMEAGADRPNPEDFEGEGPGDGDKPKDEKPESEPRPADTGKGAAATKSAASPAADAGAKANGSAGDSIPATADPNAGNKAPSDKAVDAKAEPDKAPEAAAGADPAQTEQIDPKTAEEAQAAAGADDDGVVIDPAAENAAEVAAAAFEKAETWLSGQIATFADLSGKDGALRLETIKTSMMETIRRWEGIDPEDAAVLLGRLNTAYLERMRFLSRHKR